MADIEDVTQQNLYTYTVDIDFRTIKIPDNKDIFGVVGDICVNRVKFEIPRYCSGYDLSEFTARIDYVNANGDPNYYEATEIKSEDDYTISFVWEFTSDVTAYAGNVIFGLKMFKLDGSTILRRFKTITANGTVLDGMDVDRYVDPEIQKDLLIRMEEKLDGKADHIIEISISDAVEAAKKKILDETASDENVKQIAKNKEDISSLKEDIKDIITKTPTEEKTDVEATEIINGSIILSSGNLSTNQYTTRFVVKRYDNVNRGKYEVYGYTQGNQCLYVVKKGDEVKAYQKVGDQIDVSGTKTLDLAIEENGCTVYVGAYESIVGWLKKYGEKKTLNNNIEVPQIDIAKITKSNLYGEKVTLNGDSIAFGAGTGGTGFMDYIASKYNMTLDKKAVSGATLANLSSRYPNKHCICTSIDTMAEDANYIIFEGGYNDWLLWTQIGTLTDTMSGDLDDTKFYGALESICRQALAKWENGKIGFIITHKINDAWRTQKQEGATYPTLDGYYQAIKNVCEKYSIPYLDLSKVSRLNTELQNYKKYTYNSDGVHPTKDGYQIFYVNTIARWMENL